MVSTDTHFNFFCSCDISVGQLLWYCMLTMIYQVKHTLHRNRTQEAVSHKGMRCRQDQIFSFLSLLNYVCAEAITLHDWCEKNIMQERSQLKEREREAIFNCKKNSLCHRLVLEKLLGVFSCYYEKIRTLYMF